MVLFRLAVLLSVVALLNGGTPIHANYNVFDRLLDTYLNSPNAPDLGISYRNLLRSASQRDEEYLPENTLLGFQYNSGESGKHQFTLGGNNKMTIPQEVKSDKSLPAYCNPPNPCPIGYTERNGCFNNFQNTAENNRKYQAAQDCPCDADHMFSCPAGSKVINTKSRKATASLGSGVAHALGNQESNEKRHSVVAKKSPQSAIRAEAQFDDYDEAAFNEGRLEKRMVNKSIYA